MSDSGESSDHNRRGGHKFTRRVIQRIGEEKVIDVLNDVEGVTEIEEIGV